MILKTVAVMMKQPPLKALVFAFALASCSSISGPSTAPVPDTLRSEYVFAPGESSFYGPFLAASEAQYAERHMVSAGYYLQQLELDPDSKYVADRAFFQLLFAGRMDEAATLAGKISKTSESAEEDDLIHLLNVLAAFRKGDWPLVRERMDQSLGAGFGFVIAPLLEAWAYGSEGNVEAARTAMAPLLESPRLASVAEEQYAYILDFLKRYDEADTAYKKLLATEPPLSLQPVIAYAFMLKRTGKPEEAKAVLGEQAVKYQNHTFLLREGGLITAGYQPTHQVHMPRGALGLVFYRLASEFAQNGSLQTAVVYLRIASYLTPEVPDIYFMLGSLLERMGKTNIAATAYNSVPPASPLKRAADARRIEALKAGGQIDLAEDLVRNALTERPDDFDMLISLGDILQRQEKFEASLEFFNRAIAQIKQAKEDDWPVYFSRGVSYERIGNWPLAERDLQTALALNKGEPSVLNYLGYSWIDRGVNIDQAKGMIEQAVTARPLDGFIMDSLGWVHYLTGDFPKAVESLERAIKLEPGDATINHHLGDAYWRVGRKIEARFQWRHALAGDAKPEEKKEILKKLEYGLPDIQEKS